MKKLLLIIALSVCGIAMAKAQVYHIPNTKTNSNQLTLEDFVKVYSHEKSYDEDFTPILKLKFKNISQKTITTIEIKADYQGYNSFDYFAPICTRTVSTNISPNETKELIIRLDKDPQGNKPKSFWPTRIRFSDGSIIDK